MWIKYLPILIISFSLNAEEANTGRVKLPAAPPLVEIAKADQLDKIIHTYAKEVCLALEGKSKPTDAVVTKMLDCAKNLQWTKFSDKYAPMNKCFDMGASEIIAQECFRKNGFSCGDLFMEAFFKIQHKVKNLTVIEKPGQYSLSGFGAEAQTAFVTSNLNPNPEFNLAGHAQVIQLICRGVDSCKLFKIAPADLSTVARVMTPGTAELYRSNPTAAGKIVANLAEAEDKKNAKDPGPKFYWALGKASIDSFREFCGLAHLKGPDCKAVARNLACAEKK